MKPFKNFLLALGLLWLLRTVLSTLADAKKAPKQTEYHIPSSALPLYLKRQIDDWVQRWAAANGLLEK